ncbi:MAG: hypothetical protein AAF366_17810 [Pseudomonadota bacterium]
MCIAIGAFMESLADMLLWERWYPLMLVGAVVLPLIAGITIMRSWGKRQAAAEVQAQADQEAYRKKVVADRMAQVKTASEEVAK